MAFWRRSKGRHALGAAVTSIPAAPPRPAFIPAALPVAPTLTAPPRPEPAATLATPPAPPAAAAPDWSFPELHQPPVAAVPAAPPGPRVELTFRDGSSASLDPDQSRALDEIAQVLTRRD